MKRQLIVILLGLALTAALPTSVGTHPLSGGDAGTGEDAPDTPDEAMPIEEGGHKGDLLPPLDTADWYLLVLDEPRDLVIEASSDTSARLIVLGPDDSYEGPATGHHTVRFDAEAGNWTIGLQSALPLPAHYFLGVKSRPVADDGHHGHEKEPTPLSEDTANGTITEADPYDAYTIEVAAYELVTVLLDTDPHAGLAVRLSEWNDHHHAHHDHGDTHHHLHAADGGKWLTPYDATVLVEIFLVHSVHEACTIDGCKTYEETGEGGDYTLTVLREPDVAFPDLAITAIEEKRRPIRTGFTPDIPNAVNERRTVQVEVTNLGEGSTLFPGIVYVLIRDDSGPWVGGHGEGTYIGVLSPGETAAVSFDWDTTTGLGDYTIEAYVMPMLHWFDADHANNHDEKETFVRVGGLV
ncbi:MAG: hypothetical protein KY455_12180 [Euryarchaeota archaeon]|nr:hypothetical protein [Euryarchaeota archaeon]